MQVILFYVILIFLLSTDSYAHSPNFFPQKLTLMCLINILEYISIFKKCCNYFLYAHVSPYINMAVRNFVFVFFFLIQC